jgi:Type II secretion system (T2SS), protein E, N-terminal domain
MVFQTSSLMSNKAASQAMRIVKEMAPEIHSSVIPRFSDLRRIPTPYQRILSLKAMRQYRCVIVGTAQGMLTLAITDTQAMSFIDFLSKITKRSIFLVLVEPSRMDLLLQRLERQERRRGRRLYPTSFLPLYHVDVIVILLTHLKQ